MVILPEQVKLLVLPLVVLYVDAQPLNPQPFAAVVSAAGTFVNCDAVNGVTVSPCKHVCVPTIVLPVLYVIVYIAFLHA